MAERRDILRRDAPGVNRAGHQGSVATGLFHPLQIFPREDPATREQPNRRVPPAQRLEQAEVDSRSRSYPTQVEHEDGTHTGSGRLCCQAHRIRGGARCIFHQRMDNRRPKLQIEAEDDATRPNDFHHTGQISEGAQCLEPDDGVGRPG
jgi:hypothetical protein